MLDEFGGIAGVATVDDILEGLVGELPEPDDPASPEIARQPDGSFLVDGATAIVDVGAVLDLDLPSGAKSREFDTAGGLIMTALGRLPRAGEVVEYAGARFAVEQMDGRRVGLVRVRVA